MPFLDVSTRDEAFAAERQLKGSSRTKKEALTRSDWKTIQQQAWGSQNPFPLHLT